MRRQSVAEMWLGRSRTVKAPVVRGHTGGLAVAVAKLKGESGNAIATMIACAILDGARTIIRSPSPG
jgi:hypothetical protein